MWNSTGLSAMTCRSVCAEAICATHTCQMAWTDGGGKELQFGIWNWEFGIPNSKFSILNFYDRFRAAVGLDHLRQQLLAQIDLRLGVVGGVALVLDDLEAEVVERPAHVVELVLGLDDDLVEAVRNRPQLLLLGERAEEALAAPVAARAADPGIEHAAPGELHVIVQPVYQVDQLRLGFRTLDLVRDLERHRHDGSRIVGQRRVGEQDQVRAADQTAGDFRRGLLARELAEELLDVLNLERALLEIVLRDVILHGKRALYTMVAARLTPTARITVLTGAGVSAASGVPTFRGAGGLWRNFRPEELATPEAFARDPRLVWEWYDWRRGLVAACRPNRAHEVLASWSRRFPRFTLITQNVDGLHEAAGTKEVVRMHGSLWHVRCARPCAAGAEPWRDDPSQPQRTQSAQSITFS